MFYHYSLGLIRKFLPHHFLWSSLSAQRSWASCPCVVAILLPHVESLQFFRLRCSLLQYRRLLPKPLKNNSDSESGCVAALRSSGTFFLMISFISFALMSPVSPSRGNPAPVHDSGLPDRRDRTPSRTACFSESRKKRQGGFMNNVVPNH